MNEIVNKFLLAGDKFMPEMHLKQPGFTYSACEPFTKSKEQIRKFKETGYTSYIYKNEIDKACFQHDMAYGDFKYLARRTASDKILTDEAFNIAKNPNFMMDMKEGSLLWFISFLIKSLKVVVLIYHIPEFNEQLAKELQKPIIKNLKKRKVYSWFKDNIWGADLADMKLISKFNKAFRFLLCIIDIFSKYAWVVPLKDKNVLVLLMLFKKY